MKGLHQLCVYFCNQIWLSDIPLSITNKPRLALVMRCQISKITIQSTQGEYCYQL